MQTHAGRPETRTPDELTAALKAAEGNVTLAASRLGMSRRGLYYLADRHHLSIEQHRAWAKLKPILEGLFGRKPPSALGCGSCGKTTSLSELLVTMEFLQSGAMVWQCPNCKRQHVISKQRPTSRQ